MSGRSNGFTVCPACLGDGFVRTGGFGARSFARCGTCQGIGQTYLDPAPPPAREKLSAALDDEPDDEQPWVTF